MKERENLTTQALAAAELEASTARSSDGWVAEAIAEEATELATAEEAAELATAEDATALEAEASLESLRRKQGCQYKVPVSQVMLPTKKNHWCQMGKYWLESPLLRKPVGRGRRKCSGRWKGLGLGPIR